MWFQMDGRSRSRNRKTKCADGGQSSGSESDRSLTDEVPKTFKYERNVYFSGDSTDSNEGETDESETEYIDFDDLPPPMTPPSPPDPNRPRICSFLLKGPLVDKPLYEPLHKDSRIRFKNGRMVKYPGFDELFPNPCRSLIPADETPLEPTGKKSQFQSSSMPPAGMKK